MAPLTEHPSGTPLLHPTIPVASQAPGNEALEQGLMILSQEFTLALQDNARLQSRIRAIAAQLVALGVPISGLSRQSSAMMGTENSSRGLPTRGPTGSAYGDIPYDHPRWKDPRNSSVPLLSPLHEPELALSLAPPPNFVPKGDETPPSTAANSPEKMEFSNRHLVASPERMDSNDWIEMEDNDDGERKASWPLTADNTKNDLADYTPTRCPSSSVDQPPRDSHSSQAQWRLRKIPRTRVRSIGISGSPNNHSTQAFPVDSNVSVDDSPLSEHTPSSLYQKTSYCDTSIRSLRRTIGVSDLRASPSLSEWLAASPVPAEGEAAPKSPRHVDSTPDHSDSYSSPVVGPLDNPTSGSAVLSRGVTPVSDARYGHFPPLNSTLFEGPDRRRSLENNIEPPSRPPGLEIPRPAQAMSLHSSDNGAEYWEGHPPTGISRYERYERQTESHVSSLLFDRSPIISRAPLNGDAAPVPTRYARPVWPRPSSNAPGPPVPETTADYVPTYGGHPRISVAAPNIWGPNPPAPTTVTSVSDAPSTPHSPLNETPSQHNRNSSPAGPAHSNSRRSSIRSCHCAECNSRNNNTHTWNPTNPNPNPNGPRYFYPPIVPPPIVPPAAAATLFVAYGLVPPGWSAAPLQPLSGLAAPQMPPPFTGPTFPVTSP